MKTSSYIIRYILMLLGIVLLFSCEDKKVQQFTVALKNTDGSSDNYTLTDGAMLLVRDNDNYLVAKAINGTDNSLEFQVVRYNIIRDDAGKTFTIRKTGDTTSKLSLARSAPLDPKVNVQVTLTGIAMMDTGQRPKGACKGNCCEATCFSTFCCSDSYECKDAPCDCKSPTSCPGNPSPQPSRFFELFRSGKDLLVVKE